MVYMISTKKVRSRNRKKKDVPKTKSLATFSLKSPDPLKWNRQKSIVQKSWFLAAGTDFRPGLRRDEPGDRRAKAVENFNNKVISTFDNFWSLQVPGDGWCLMHTVNALKGTKFTKKKLRAMAKKYRREFITKEIWDEAEQKVVYYDLEKEVVNPSNLSETWVTLLAKEVNCRFVIFTCQSRIDDAVIADPEQKRAAKPKWDVWSYTAREVLPYVLTVFQKGDKVKWQKKEGAEAYKVTVSRDEKDGIVQVKYKTKHHDKFHFKKVESGKLKLRNSKPTYEDTIYMYNNGHYYPLMPMAEVSEDDKDRLISTWGNETEQYIVEEEAEDEKEDDEDNEDDEFDWDQHQWGLLG